MRQVKSSSCLGLSVFVFVSIIIIPSPTIDEFIPEVNHQCNYILLYK